jgi:hypothetical protein
MGKFGVVLALAVTALAGSASPADAPALLTPLEQAQVQRAEDRGRMIYAFDQAAWYSTDEMMRQVARSNLPRRGGWIVEPKGDLLRVTFFGLEGDAPLAYFRADMAGATVVESHLFTNGEDRTLSAVETRMALAEQTAAAERRNKGRCTAGSFNTVVLPPAAPNAPVAVYLLSSMVTTGEYPAGGHYEIDVGSDGKVASQREFTKSCLNLNPQAGAKAGATPAAVIVTHLLDPTPTEIHVYLSLWMGQPVYVLTPPDGQAWAVQAGHVIKTGFKAGQKH